MGCKQGKASQPTARSAGLEDAVKSPLLLGSQDVSAKIKDADPRLSTEASMKTFPGNMKPDIPISDEQETEPGSQHETFTAATSTEPESEIPCSLDDAQHATAQQALPMEQADNKAQCCLDPESSSPTMKCQQEQTIYGAWSEATISGTTLIFHDTRETVAIQFMNPREFKMIWKGENCKAALRDDGRLHWSDGDIWTRAKPATTTAPSLAKEEELRAEALKNASIRGHYDRSFNFQGASVTTAADIQKAGEAAAARAKDERSGLGGCKLLSEEKTARKERPVCCC